MLEPRGGGGGRGFCVGGANTLDPRWRRRRQRLLRWWTRRGEINPRWPTPAPLPLVPAGASDPWPCSEIYPLRRRCHPSIPNPLCNCCSYCYSLPSSSGRLRPARQTSQAAGPCQGLNITYPFWLEEPGRPPCGPPSFQLKCNSSGAFMSKSVYQAYQVLSIFPENNSFHVVGHNLPLVTGIPSLHCQKSRRSTTCS